MYLHAFQSYVWNVVVSERIKRFGIVAGTSILFSLLF
jgi:tRNA(Glu) U13 pseudouridine synthase TruD